MDGRMWCGRRLVLVLGVVLLTALVWCSVPEARTAEHEEEHGWEIDWVSDDAHHLFRQSQELREQGKPDAAEELLLRAKRIEREARAHRQREEKGEREVDWVSEDAHHLFRQSQELKEQGKPDAAEELLLRAKNIEREARARRKRETQIREHAGRAERRFTSDEAHQLYAKGLALQRERRRDAAAELFEKAERVEMDARERAERREHAGGHDDVVFSPDRDRPADAAKLRAEIAELRQDVRRLQQQVEELTALVRRLVRE